jgi:pSer/pThr/pTyr-binding forkhead associated (FHA) protein
MKRPPIIMVQLIHIFGPLKGQINEFSQDVITIGRHPSCHLHFPADLTIMSRNHAEIVREGNQFKLTDLSANGTFVNGKKVKEVYLKTGDVLTFADGGPKVSFLTQLKEDSYEPEIRSVPQVQETPVQKPKIRIEERIPVLQPPAEKPAQPPVQSVRVPLTIQYGATIRSFKELPVTVGKSPGCNFVIDHPAVFDQHAQLFFTDNQYWIKDLTGQNLIRLNHQPIPFQSPLTVNDEIALSPRGPSFRFLGEGRLAEITGSDQDMQYSGEKDNLPKASDKKEQPSDGILSKFKKFWGPSQQ